MKSKKKGFSIVELMISFVIVSILSVIGISIYNGYITRVNNAQVVAITSQYVAAAKRYYVLYGHYPSSGDLEFHCLGSAKETCGLFLDSHSFFPTTYAFKQEGVEEEDPIQVKFIFDKNIFLENEIKKGFKSENGLPKVPEMRLAHKQKWNGILYKCSDQDCMNSEFAWVLTGANKSCEISGSHVQHNPLIEWDEATLCTLLSI